ncbi:MAG: ECF transporter S component [Actinobacteria bacterium]|nr:ECF transporter S component [Actinomycetota bacterium]
MTTAQCSVCGREVALAEPQEDAPICESCAAKDRSPTQTIDLGISKRKLSTRTIVPAGLLAALTVALSALGIGLIPVPNASGAMTTVHIPIIIGGIMLGPVAGSLLGLILGVFTLSLGPWPAVIPARLLIGPVAYYVYRATPNKLLGAALAGFAGTLTNTIGVLGMAVLIKLIPLKVALGIAGFNGTIEVILAILIVTPVVRGLKQAKIL